jgi:hypothetical protein
MANIEETFERTMKAKAAIDAARAVKRFNELVKSGVDPTTAFLQVFCGVYYLVSPIPRPDYLSTMSDLYYATKEAHSHLTLLKDEAEEAMAFLEELMKHEK